MFWGLQVSLPLPPISTPEKSTLGTNVNFFPKGSLILSIFSLILENGVTRDYGGDLSDRCDAPCHCDAPMWVIHALPGGLPQGKAESNKPGFGL